MDVTKIASESGWQVLGRTEAHTSVAAVVEHILQSSAPLSEHERADSSRFLAYSVGQPLPIGRAASTPLPAPSPRQELMLTTQLQPPNGLHAKV